MVCSIERSHTEKVHKNCKQLGTIWIKGAYLMSRTFYKVKKASPWMPYHTMNTYYI